jgi:hypothetical protein
MGSTIVIPLLNPGATLMPLLQSLVSATDDSLYDVIFVDQGSTDGTLDVLEQLEGDLTIIRAGEPLAIGACANRALLQAKGDVVVLASTQARFSARWLDRLYADLQTNATATLPGVDPRHLTAFRVDVLRSVGGFDETADANTLLQSLAQRLQAEQQRAMRAQSMNVPQHVLGYRTGEAIAQLLASGEQGARIGDLPPEHAERLRERLWQEEERRMLLQARAGRDVCWTDEDVEEPLVTVRIVTHNRAAELMEIALPSALEQTYENLDILVIGDHTDDATVKAMQSVRDPRVRFYNLPAPSMYPTMQWGYWMVHGSPAMNLGIELAAGSWINPADDDDAMTPDHVEIMLREARERRLEFVWSQTLMKHPDGWQIIGTEPLGSEGTTAGAVMWTSGLRFMRMSTTCWKLPEPHDQNMWRRMHEIGVNMGFVPAITYRYIPAVH